MKLEYKVAASTTAFLIALGAASIASALQHHEAPPVPRPKPVRQIIIPIDGVAPEQLTNSWGAPRTGHSHEGIDIFAKKGTPVLAVAAGTIAKLFKSKLGGTTVYQLDGEGRLIFYYAHLNGYADGLKVGDAVVQGQVLGYVGATGNATTPHLHFEIQHANANRDWWRGASFNPYFTLKTGRAG